MTLLHVCGEAWRASTTRNGLQSDYVLVKSKETDLKKFNLSPSLEQSGSLLYCIVRVDAVIMQPHL